MQTRAVSQERFVWNLNCITSLKDLQVATTMSSN